MKNPKGSIVLTLVLLIVGLLGVIAFLVLRNLSMNKNTITLPSNNEPIKVGEEAQVAEYSIYKEGEDYFKVYDGGYKVELEMSNWTGPKEATNYVSNNEYTEVYNEYGEVYNEYSAVYKDDGFINITRLADNSTKQIPISGQVEDVNDMMFSINNRYLAFLTLFRGKMEDSASEFFPIFPDAVIALHVIDLQNYSEKIIREIKSPLRTELIAVDKVMNKVYWMYGGGDGGLYTSVEVVDINTGEFEELAIEKRSLDAAALDIWNDAAIDSGFTVILYKSFFDNSHEKYYDLQTKETKDVIIK